MPNIVEIIVAAKNTTAPVFAEVKAGATGMESAMSKLNKVAAAGALAMIGFGVESVKMASKFDSEMALLNTQAGVSQDKIAGLSKGVLSLSGKVAQDPDSLAESLFHVESNFESMGISSEKALKLTETAAKGATVGHANLVDVTNALTAAVASGIPGVEDFDQAMGVLNATVGVGDMKMQDLAAAFGSGMVATVKGFGLNITDVGAALAVFGDNNIRGALAGTQLRMSVMALAKPIATAGDTLKRLGLTQTTLAQDMQKGGLKLALEDLVDRMNKAGISADQQGQVITDAFGRKAGAGLNVLVSQMDRLESKYPALEKGATNFSAAWEATTHTFAFQMKSLEEKLNALMISVGEKLIPKIQALVKFLGEHKDATIAVAEATAGLLAGIMAFSAVSKVVTVFQGLQKVYQESTVAMAAYQARIVEVQAASLAAGVETTKLGAAFTALGTKAKLTLAAAGIGLMLVALDKLSEMGKTAPPNIDRLDQSLSALGHTGVVTGELAKTFGSDLRNLGDAVDHLAGKSKSANDKLVEFFSWGGMKASDIGPAKEQINALDESLANLVKSGHADLAAAALTRMQNALKTQGKDPSLLAGDLHKYGDALGDLNLVQKLSADSMGVFGDQALVTSDKLNTQALSAEGLKEAYLNLNDAFRATLDTQAGFEASVAAVAKAVAEHGRALHYTNGQLDLSTEAARAEEGALSDLAAKTEEAIIAAAKNGANTADVNAIFDRGREKLIQYAQAMGMTKDEADILADRILRMPDKTITVTTNFVYNDQVYSYKRGQSQENGNAHGGIIGGAATGGARGGMTWVGEQGPELVRLPYGSTVHSAPDSQRMAGGRSGGEQRVVIELHSGGSRLDDLLLEVLRKSIRIMGGNVQTALGQ